MQINNDIHFSTDAYLISKKKYDAENPEPVKASEDRVDLTTQKLEEKHYAESINAVPAPHEAAAKQGEENSIQEEAINAAEASKAIASYNEVAASPSSQDYFNQVEEMV